MIGASSDDQMRCADIWMRKIYPTPTRQSLAATPKASKNIRIAYLSPDFHRHATAYLTAGLFELHDRSRLDVMGISFGPDDNSDMRSCLIKAFD